MGRDFSHVKRIVIKAEVYRCAAVRPRTAIVFELTGQFWQRDGLCNALIAVAVQKDVH